jgi:hypothetical protein
MTKHNDMKQRIQSMDSRLSGRGEGLTMVVWTLEIAEQPTATGSSAKWRRSPKWVSKSQTVSSIRWAPCVMRRCRGEAMGAHPTADSRSNEHKIRVSRSNILHEWRIAFPFLKLSCNDDEHTDKVFLCDEG